MDYKAMFKGDFISAAEFCGKTVTMTVKSIKSEELPDLSDATGEKKKWKGVMSFVERDRPMIINKTNAICIAGMFGRATDNWIGKKISFYSVPVTVNKEEELGIRVKGSPDISTPVEVKIKFLRKKAFFMTMEPTGKGHTPPPDNAPPQDPATDLFNQGVPQ